MKNKYFQSYRQDNKAVIKIFGDIVDDAYYADEVSALSFISELEQLGDVDSIDVYINSYGGSVSQGFVIYNHLKNHPAKVTTICSGFACSIASIIFMAGDERVMNEASLLMIHNAWTLAEGNAAALRKQADDLEKITQASVEAYKAHSSLEEKEIKALMDAETWITPDEAISYGFATSSEKTEKAKASQNALHRLFEIVKAYRENTNDDEEPEDTLDEDEQENPDENPEDIPDDESEEDPSTDDPEEDDPEENTDTETPPDDSEEDSDTTDDESDEDEQDEEQPVDENEKAAQMWNGFFSALKNM